MDRQESKEKDKLDFEYWKPTQEELDKVLKETFEKYGDVIKELAKK